MKFEGWKYLGGSWGTSSGTSLDLVEILGEVEAKMGAKCANLGQSWRQVATKMGQDSAKLAILGSTWEVLGACWEHFRSILAHGLDGRKPTKAEGKHRFFGRSQIVSIGNNAFLK